MSPQEFHYTVDYYPLVGKAEIIRALLTLGDAKFDEKFTPLETWKEHKDEYPFGQVPLLRITDAASGKVVAELTESSAIERFLANRFGYGGANEYEDAQITALRLQFERVFYSIYEHYWTEGKAEEHVKGLHRNLKYLIKYHERVLAKNGGNGHYVGDKITIPDLYAVLLYTLTEREGFKDDLNEDDAPLFNKVVQTVMAEPKLKKYYEDVAERNITQMAADFPNKIIW
ncbi:hypothetical protein GQ42DRAFT_52556 [Ramicandelaber brevisporus]|nr:hypothetical protein GQ42DRAFT_52556 [Ramicandelaber brevisporus]